jgi:hypothetical protein
VIKNLFEVHENIDKDAESDPGVKAAADACFKRMEDRDEDALKNWRVWRELSVKKYAEEFDRLNVHFDVYTGRKQSREEAWEEVAKLCAGTPERDETDRRRGGSKAGRLGKVEMLGVISSQQDLHTAQFIKMLNLKEFPWEQNVEHVNYGLVLGMSTRKGTVVFQIIRRAASMMHEQTKKNEGKYAAVEHPEQTSLKVGLAAIKIQDMAAKRYVGALFILSLFSQMQDKQLQLQLRPHNVFRGRHRSIPTIRARPADLAHAQEPRSVAALTASGDRGGDAREARHRARDYMPVRHVPGRRPHHAAHARAEPASSRLRSASRMRSRTRGRPSLLRAMRASSGRGRGCGCISVRGTCLAPRCGC